MTGPVLVTGATGFLGSHLCRYLLDEGRAVTATRRPTSDTAGLADLDLEWVTADVLDAAAVREAVAGHRHVVHLAGVGLDRAPAGTVRRVNREGTRNVLDACEAAGVDRLVFASTAGTRRSDGVADETDVATPIGAYQRGKREAERLLDRRVARGLDAVTVHPTSVFGPGDGSFTARLVALVTGPSPVYLPGGTSFVGVDDIVAGLVAALERGTPGEHYLLAGENLTYREALAVIASHVDARAPPFRVPEPAVHAAGHLVGAVNETFGTRLFPFGPEMARLVTREHFYTAAKAERELGYDYEPLAAHVPAVAEGDTLTETHTAGSVR